MRWTGRAWRAVAWFLRECAEALSMQDAVFAGKGWERYRDKPDDRAPKAPAETKAILDVAAVEVGTIRPCERRSPNVRGEADFPGRANQRIRLEQGPDTREIGEKKERGVPGKISETILFRGVTKTKRLRSEREGEDEGEGKGSLEEGRRE